jgi:hypothetical protein
MVSFFSWQWDIDLGFTLLKDEEQAIRHILNEMGRSTMCIKGSLVSVLLINEETARLCQSRRQTAQLLSPLDRVVSDR